MAKTKKSNSAHNGVDVDIGISAKHRKKIAKNLNCVLADAFVLYMKTHAFHWNIVGPMFQTLHTMFEQQYTEQWRALDEVAERIRSLGFHAPGSMREFIELSSIEDESGKDLGWEDMVSQLVKSNEALCRTARKAIRAAEKAEDHPTVDLLTTRLHAHEKTAWMLRSLLQ